MARTLVGRYELEAPIGSGGMGEVWRGRDLATRRPVAVKLVQLASIDDQALVAETITRFRREAETLARLRHPSIVPALEAGRAGNELFMVMELAEGISLAAMLRLRQANGLGLFPVGSVLGIAGQACSGLAAAHEIGVVHRDIKPGNLMVSARGRLTIVDFGIARLLEDNSPRLTAAGETVGTLTYMSPEQAAGIDVDGRSDLYSFGCVLYELLAGRPPFTADVPIALMRMHLQERPVPVRDVRPDLPGGLPELVDRLLEKDRGARPPDAGYVARVLAGISGNFDGGVPEHEIDVVTVLGGHQRQGTGKRSAASGPHEGYSTTVLDNGGGVPQDPADQVLHQENQGLPDVRPPVQGSGPVSGSGRAGKGEYESRPAANGRPPGRHTGRPRPRRRRWPGVLSSLLTFAIVAGVAAYVWNKTHQTLKVTAATVSVANPGKIACNSTVDVVGTIFTNGNGGPITYQWTKNGQNLPTSTVTAASGQQQVRVHLKWNLRGKGTLKAVAIFQVFTPNVVSAQSAAFTYKCA